MNSQIMLFLAVALVLSALNLALIGRAPIRYFIRLNAGFFALMGFEYMFARSGVLSNFEAFPPPIAIFLALIVSSAILATFTVFGKLYLNLPFQWLVGFQTFRFLAESVIAFGVAEGIAPKQLSMYGFNFDVVVAAFAAIVTCIPALYQNRKVLWAFNLFGITSLINIAFIAMTSFPNAIRLFHSDPDNSWVTRAPYVFLPGILVLSAMFGHSLLTRKLLLSDPKD